MIRGGLVYKLIFQNVGSGYLGFGPVAENAVIFARDGGSNFFINVPLMATQLKRMVMKLRNSLKYAFFQCQIATILNFKVKMTF